MMKKILKATCVGVKNSAKDFFEGVMRCLPAFLWMFCFLISCALLSGLLFVLCPGIFADMQDGEIIVIAIVVMGYFMATFMTTFGNRVKYTIQISDETGKSFDEVWKETKPERYNDYL